MRWSLLFLAACGGGSSLLDARFGDDDAPSFIFDAPKLDSTICTMFCGGVCTDTNTDPQHCGTCTNVCPTSAPSCSGGTCYQPQATAWVTHFGGADFGNTIDAVATDTAGNIYVTGSMAGAIDLGGGALTSAGASDILVASFTSNGMLRWSKRFGSTGIDQGAGIAVFNGQVYVVADFIGTVDFGGGPLVSAGGSDIVVLTLDWASGDFHAAQRYGTANSDTGIAIGVDFNGYIAFGGFFGQGTLDVGGFPLVGAGQDNGFVASLDSALGTRWTRMLASSGTGDLSSCQALAVDPNGDVVTAGVFSGTVNFGAGTVTASGSDAFVASYDSLGTPRWSHVFGGPQYDTANAIAVDGTGNVVVGGNYHGNVDFGTGTIPSTGSVDGFLVGYTATGGFRFARHLGAATTSTVSGLATTATGGVVATGHLSGAADLGTGPLVPLGMDDVFVAELNAGTATYAKRYGGVDYDEGVAVSIGPTGLVTIGGLFRGTADFGTGAIAGGAKDNGFVMTIAP